MGPGDEMMLKDFEENNFNINSCKFPVHKLPPFYFLSKKNSLVNI